MRFLSLRAQRYGMNNVPFNANECAENYANHRELANCALPVHDVAKYEEQS